MSYKRRILSALMIVLSLGCQSYASTGVIVGADAGGVGLESAPIFYVGSYGYLGKLDPKSAQLTTLLYPKVDYRGLAYGGGKFIAVGQAGQIISSPLGSRSWQTVASMKLHNYNSVRYINQRFVAVGDNGIVSISADGLSWNHALTLPANENYTLQDVAGVGSDLVLIGGNGLLYGIKSGIKSRLVSPTKNTLNGIVYAQAKYVIVGNNGTIITSSDNGNTWQIAASPVTSSLNSIKYLNGKFIAVGGNGVVLSSLDGTTWQLKAANPNWAISDISYDSSTANYRLIAFDGKDSLILSSTNLLQWAEYQGITTDYRFNRVECQSEFCQEIGNRGMNLFSANGGANWQILKANSTEFSLVGVAYQQKQIVAVGLGGALLSSTDAGQSWSIISAGYQNYDFTTVKYLNGAFYATASNGSLLRSSNGSSWSKLNSGTTQGLNDIAYHATLTKAFYPWIAVGNQGIVLSSMDGESWTLNKAALAPLKLNQVNYNPISQSFWISGEQGSLFSSHNLRKNNKFTQHVLPSNNNLLAVNNGQLSSATDANKSLDTMFIVGDNATLFYAKNTKPRHWQALNCDLLGRLSTIRYLNGRAYVSGQLGILALIKLDALQVPSCQVINSATDVSLWGSSATQ